MRAICFGKLVVQDAGVPVQLGRTTLGADMTASDETLAVTSATPFCSDMVPFKMDIDPTGDRETVVVIGISGTTFTVQRGIDGTEPLAHTTGAVVMARFPFAGLDLSAIAGLTGSVYFGKVGMTPGGAGTIFELAANPSASVSGSDHRNFMTGDSVGNSLNLTDYEIGVSESGEGPYLTLWER